jgi:tetratricopeptide (TPR) repeat protein
MIHEFIKIEDEPPFTELYILTGRRTFSAAVMALDAFTSETLCTIVGEPSGAPLNSYGDADSKKFAKTGLQLYTSTLWHQLNEYDAGAWVYVDVPAPFSFADYAAGRDPAVDAILAGQEMRSIPVIARQSGGARARAVLKARVKTYAKYPWWTPPSFQDLKRVGYDLLEDLKQPADAVEMFELLVELHPDSWNAWESLGRAQIAAGDEKAALESYQCALAIDSDTFEDGDLRSVIAKSAAPVAKAKGCPA